MGFYSEAICDWCDAELESEDTGGSILFKADEAADLEPWGWHEIRAADGTSQLICRDCWESPGAEEARVAVAKAAPARYDQTGPNLLDGGPS